MIDPHISGKAARVFGVLALRAIRQVYRAVSTRPALRRAPRRGPRRNWLAIGLMRRRTQSISASISGWKETADLPCDQRDRNPLPKRCGPQKVRASRNVRKSAGDHDDVTTSPLLPNVIIRTHSYSSAWFELEGLITPPVVPTRTNFLGPQRLSGRTILKT